AAARRDIRSVRSVEQGLGRLPEGERNPADAAAIPGEGWRPLMAVAIRKHLRDFLAVLWLILVALVATYIIVQNQRLRIPLLESKPFELKADLSTAQAVTP